MGLGRVVALLFVAWTSFGCGYFQAGSWEDDPGNWKRAFGVEAAEDVVVVHSHYWRAAHWSWEGGYSFEIEANPRLLEEWITAWDLRVLDPPDVEHFGAPPRWFAPKPLAAYEVHGATDRPWNTLRLLVDRETGRLFLTWYQI